ncbi:16S rRNA (guanine(966)-N(2))-methyltransferase RsmD [Propionibacteriaceae bacterium Y1685]|uniref:16S rRNA (guanine(966)-N(2))-methyltransferase RsmD n=1 Tax=Microlunatus sp. Y1700 TaxID=3418487 RepID=UPI003B7FF209
MTRIIAGSHGGRRLTMPAGQGTRPTSDRVKEAVFTALTSWLGTVGADPADSLADQGFCDLYAGSGAMGLEAASRGAAPVLLVERERKASGVIRRNADDLGLGVEIASARVETLVAQPSPTAYDIVWLDPPYDVSSDALDRVVADLVGQGWIAPNGIIAIERSGRSTAPQWPDGFTDGWTKNYGDTAVHFGCG